MINKTALSILILVFLNLSLMGYFEREVYFENTDYELNVYKSYGSDNGKTMMIIGGIQGDEAGGYLTADLYVNMALQKGNLIVVPRANFLSIIKQKRRINYDMNRLFELTSENGKYETEVVQILKKLILESDILLNLHEGSGFYSEEWISEMINPMRFGQSIIADASVYYSEKSGGYIYLEQIAEDVISMVNTRIDIDLHKFKFNNHNTASDKSKHKEQRKSATYYALTSVGIPAYGIETSKSIKDIELKVKYESMIISEFMNYYDIIPEHPQVSFETPQLNYLLLTVNGMHNIFVKNNNFLSLYKGDEINITDINSNYPRGLSADIIGKGAYNDMNKDYIINNPTSIIVRKDNMKIGEIPIYIKTDRPILESSNIVTMQEIKILHNDSPVTLKKGKHLNVVRGDMLRITDILATIPDKDALIVNFVGFVGGNSFSSAEDRGLDIDTGELLEDWSLNKQGREYEIYCEYNKRKIGSSYVTLIEPELYSMTIEKNSVPVRVDAGATLEINSRDKIKLTGLKSNIDDNYNVSVNLKGFDNGMRNVIDDRNIVISYKDEYTQQSNFLKEYNLQSSAEYEIYEILVSRKGDVFGKVYLKIHKESS